MGGIRANNSAAGRVREAAELLSEVDGQSFAPAFGLSYGLLMDRKRRAWRDLLDGDVDLGLVAREVWGLTPPLVSNQEVERRANRYANR